jgi:hypothetical protein
MRACRSMERAAIDDAFMIALSHQLPTLFAKLGSKRIHFNRVDTPISTHCVSPGGAAEHALRGGVTVALFSRLRSLSSLPASQSFREHRHRQRIEGDALALGAAREGGM